MEKAKLQVVLIVMSCMVLIGCAPSIRYTRSRDGQIHYMVPRDWDYRKNYKVSSGHLEKIINSYIGVPYRTAGMSRRGVDCSGFVCLVYKELNRIELPHSSKKLSRYGREVAPGDAKAGDLVFFKGGLFRGINHVGIVLNDNKFAHASTQKGVIYSSLDEEYYKERFAEIRRIF